MFYEIYQEGNSKTIYGKGNRWIRAGYVDKDGNKKYTFIGFFDSTICDYSYFASYEDQLPKFKDYVGLSLHIKNNLYMVQTKEKQTEVENEFSEKLKDLILIKKGGNLKPGKYWISDYNQITNIIELKR